MLKREYAIIAVLMVLVCILAMANVSSSDDEAMTRPVPTRSFACARRGGGGAAPPAGGGAAPPAGGGAAPPAARATAANAILLGAANNAVGAQNAIVTAAVADARHWNEVMQGLAEERLNGLQSSANDLNDLRSSRRSGLLVLGVIALILAVILAVMIGKSIYEPTPMSTSTVALPVSSSPPSAVTTANPSVTPATGKDVTCGTATSPCPQAIVICQNSANGPGAKKKILDCCSQISDSAQREQCTNIINARP